MLALASPGGGLSMAASYAAADDLAAFMGARAGLDLI
jgi:hypothetical protein